jgi:hypothetical protein
MATWQFDLEVVPAARVLSQPRTSEGYVDEHARESIDWWEGASLPPDYARRLGAMLPWSVPWAAGWHVFGEEDSNRVDVIEEGGRIAEVRARIDARSMDLDVIDGIVQLVEEWDCVFLTSRGRVVEPSLDAVWIELELSPASSFVQDPAAFLGRLRQHRRRGGSG